MYGDVTLERGVGSTDLIMLDFGDGTEPVVELEPQMAQPQQFITIDFDAVQENVIKTQTSTEPMVSLEPVASQFIMIDFGEGEELNNKKEEIPQQPQTQQFITIDFDEIIANNMEHPARVQTQQEEKSKFMEISFDDEPAPFMQTEQTPQPVQTQVAYAHATAKEPPQSKRPANTVLFFVPGVEQGLLIYNQSPDGVEAKLTGYLPEGKFYASGMEPVKFDPNKHSDEFDVIRTPEGPYIQQVIMVDEKKFMKIALQGIYPQSPADERKRHYFVVDINDTQRDVRKELIQATYEEENLHPVAGSIFDTIREVGKTDEGKRVIGDIVTGSISKSQKQ